MRDTYQKLATTMQGGILHVRTNNETTTICVGYRELANQLPVTEDTLFPTASVGKVFTAVGVLQLIDQGKLSLSDTIGDVLTFDLGHLDPKVTIEQLLTHTSGVPDYCDESRYPNYADLWIHFPNYKIRKGSDLLPLFIDEPMMYEKGSRAQYNNSAFVLLGLVIEDVSKTDFYTYLKDNLFIPLGMERSCYCEFDRLKKNTASGYLFDTVKQEPYTHIYSLDARGSGAGGAFTTVLDMDRFWDGLLGGAILSNPMVEDMLTPRVELEGAHYGLGVWLDKEGNPFVDGVDPGATARSWCNRKTKDVISVFSNFEDNVFEVFHQVKNVTISS